MAFSSSKRLLAIFVYTILFLFFFQLLNDFVAGIYAFGVLGTGLPAEMGLLVVFILPYVHLVAGRQPSALLLIILAELVLLSRAIEIFLATRNQLIVSGLGAGLFLYLLPALIRDRGQKGDLAIGRQMAWALSLAVSCSIALRALGSSMDLSNIGMFRSLAWLMAAGAGLLVPAVFRQETAIEAVKGSESAGSGRLVLLAIGLLSIFTLLYFAFTSPIVMANWTRVDYRPIVAGSAAVVALYAGLLASGRMRALKVNGALALTVIFVLALAATLATHQFALPDDPNAYPLFEPGPGPVSFPALALLLLSFPILFIDFAVLVDELVLLGPSVRQLGLGFGLASLFMLVMILSHVFTSAWAYVDPILEPLFHHRFWHVHLVTGLFLILALLAAGRGKRAIDMKDQRVANVAMAGVVAVLALITILSVLLLAPDSAPPVGVTRLKVAGYNIQQGYDIDGQRSHQQQCRVLKEIGADIIGLSESDTARVAGGNFDIDHFLATCLDMYAYGGPRSGAGTFGYALLSRFPIEEAETIHLRSGPGLRSADDPEETSSGDQVAVIKAQVQAGDQTFTILVNHFDGNPPREQAEGLASLTVGLENAIAVGDFNCRPGGRCLEIIEETLVHCANERGDANVAQDRVDHIFVSGDLSCQNYAYVESDASDHPVVVAEIEW